MNSKKLAAFILAGVLMTTQTALISADNTDVVLDGTVDYDLGKQAEGEYGIMLISENEEIAEVPSYMNISGKIAEINKNEEGIIESVLVEKDDETKVLLVVSEETVAVDTNGLPFDMAELKIGAEIDAAQSMAQTMSIPPQSAAFAIIVKAEDEITPKYIEISKLYEEDGILKFESADGRHLIMISDETEFAPFKTRNIVTKADLKEGSKVLVWYDFSTRSIPEQATATKVMILPTPSEEIIGAEISGKTIDFDKYSSILPTVEDGITYLPVRAIAETIGATVTWNEKTKGIEIKTDKEKAELTIGKAYATVAGKKVELAAETKIVGDRTVVGVTGDLDQYGIKFITE